MNLTPHFTVAEFTASAAARERGLDNTLPATLLHAARETCELMERIRALLGRLRGSPVAIEVTSGYRASAVNAAVGGSAGSDHIKALAVDFKAPGFGSPYEVAAALAPHVSELGIGQLIHEFGAWVHVSTRTPDKAVNRILTYSRGNPPAVGIHEV